MFSYTKSETCDDPEPSLDAFLSRAIVFPYVRTHVKNTVERLRKTKDTFEVKVAQMSLEEKQRAVYFLRMHYSNKGSLYDDADEEAFHWMAKEDNQINNVKLPRLDEPCPPSGVECRSRDFDNLKIFYHLDNPSLYPQGTYTFYIGRRGCQPHECIDWYFQGIRIDAKGFDGKWGECRLLKVPGGTHARVHYTFEGSRRTFNLVFPYPTAEELRVVFPMANFYPAAGAEGPVAYL